MLISYDWGKLADVARTGGETGRVFGSAGEEPAPGTDAVFSGRL